MTSLDEGSDAPAQARTEVRERGTNQAGVRAYNERLLMSLIRRHGTMPKAEMARQTGLSAQTVSVIMRSLEGDGLVRKEKPRRGKVGQPLVPFSLNPDGAYSIGLQIGRRSCTLLTLDLAGEVRSRRTEIYSYPTPADVLKLAREGFEQIGRELGAAQRKRILGVGIAAPFELWSWQQEVGAPHDAMEAWRGVDIAAEIRKISPWPVAFCNDATAACAAELFFGGGKAFRDFAYFYLGFFVGGGVVLNGSLYQGRTGYAGAMGTLPVPSAAGAEQLIRHASVYVLERRLVAAGFDPLWLSHNRDDWSAAEPHLGAWIEETASSLAYAALACACVIDFEAVIIDGGLPPPVRRRIVAATLRAFEAADRRGIGPLEICEGSIGYEARAMGGAALSLIADFAIDRDVLFKEPV